MCLPYSRRIYFPSSRLFGVSKKGTLRKKCKSTRHTCSRRPPKNSRAVYFFQHQLRALVPCHSLFIGTLREHRIVRRGRTTWTKDWTRQASEHSKQVWGARRLVSLCGVLWIFRMDNIFFEVEGPYPWVSAYCQNSLVAIELTQRRDQTFWKSRMWLG